MTLPGISEYRRTAFKSIPGWMHDLDLELFDRILAHQLDAGFTGDMLEIGSYHGKSAIAMGYGLREDETLAVCDLFGAEVDGVPDEGMAPYGGLTSNAFMDQYSKFHDRQPLIWRGASSGLDLAGFNFRFAHIDGGHAYDVVRDDIALVHPHALNGVIVLDDYRTEHTPGVSAAVWEATSQGLLFPFLLSEVKVYAATTQQAQRYWFEACWDLKPAEVHSMHGYDVIRVWH